MGTYVATELGVSANCGLPAHKRADRRLDGQQEPHRPGCGQTVRTPAGPGELSECRFQVGPHRPLLLCRN